MKKVLAVIGLIAFGVAGRLLPHVPNATPITAVAYSGGKYVGKVWAVVIPLAAMLLSDAVIGFYDWRVLLSVYVSFALIGILAGLLKNAGRGAVDMIIVSPVLFFLVTNFAVWMTSPWYEKSAVGLLMSYELGLPFLGAMLLGDALFIPLVLFICKAALHDIPRMSVVSSRYAAGASVLLLAFSTPASLYADTAGAVSYLETHQGSAWVSMALSASGGSPDTEFLRSASGTSAIDFEAPILAITASGNDPRTFSSDNLVEKLRSFYTDGQIGDPTLLNDDIFGILALISSGVTASEDEIAETRGFLLQHQNADGGWAFQVGGASDTNTTAAAVMALLASGSGSSDPAIENALVYLHGAQNTNGGFPYDPESSWGTDSDASSDAWVIMALNAARSSPSSWATDGGTPQDSLLSFQSGEGYFQYQTGTGEDAFSPVTTAYAVLALQNQTLPVRIVAPVSPPPPPESPAPVLSAGGGGGNGMIFASPPLLNPSSIPASSAASSSESTDSAAVYLEEVQPAGRVLGENVYFFERTLRFGSYGDAVTELHKILIAGGYLAIDAPTGWFGPLTFAAVKKYQVERDIPDTGLVGPITRAALNSPAVADLPTTQSVPNNVTETAESASSTPEAATSTPPAQPAPILGGGGAKTAPSNQKPKIVLQGASEMHLAEGVAFSDPGARASDAEGGDLSAAILVSGTVDIFMPGTYQLIYAVTDKNGVSDTKVRKIVVDAPAPLSLDAQTPRYALSPAGENADLAITSSNNADPKFTSVRITPLHVYVGDTQTLTVVLTSSVPVTTVTATMVLDNQTVTIPLSKSAADPSGNTYQASWVVFDTHVATYKTTFTARNEAGKENSTTLAWSDPCAGVMQGADSSLSGNCSVSAVSGLDGGNLTIPQGVTLTLGSGAVWVWNPGTSVTVKGAIAVSGTASAKKGYLFYSGSTNDSANTVTAYYGPSATMSGYVRVGPLFVFDDLYDVLPGTKTSNTVTIRGIPNGSPVTLTDSGMGESNMLMRVNGGTWSATGTMNSGDTLAIKFTGSEYLTTYGVTATVGGSSSTFYVTTREEFCKFC
jgi:membrane-bound inhibitor of C-type lysozyme